MMENYHLIKFYPVGNADNILIQLSDGTTIVIDCKIPKEVQEDLFDVKSDMLKYLKKDSKGHPYVDLYISTHPHDDHCSGFEDNYYHGLPSEYDNKKDEGKIIIGELWISAMGMLNDIADSTAAVRREANRRREIYNKNPLYKGQYGNYLRIVGYDEDKTYNPRYGYIPGTLVNEINGEKNGLLDIFIHAPFKDSITEGKEADDKNESSIVTQMSFRMQTVGNIVCKALFGGDASYDVWEKILKNTTDEEKLKWNILLAPHHCSWRFFNESSDKWHTQDCAIKILNKKEPNAEIITSSLEIKNNDKDQDPPSYAARTQYLLALKNDSSKFRNTATDDIENGIPQPIEYHIDQSGKTKIKRIPDPVQSITSTSSLRAGYIK